MLQQLVFALNNGKESKSGSAATQGKAEKMVRVMQEELVRMDIRCLT